MQLIDVNVQELVLHMINFNLRKATEKQVDVTGVLIVSFTGGIPQILRSLLRSGL
jgi:hypothetical protein